MGGRETKREKDDVEVWIIPLLVIMHERVGDQQYPHVVDPERTCKVDAG